MSRSSCTRAALALAVFTATHAAYAAETIILQDNFESYADTAAMNAVWNANATNTSTLNTTLPGLTEGSTTKSLNNTPTASNQHAARSFDPISPTADSSILWQFDYFWDGGGNKRLTGGIRNGTNYILEMGYYNAARNPFTSPEGGNANGAGMAVRTVNVPGSGGPTGLPENTFGAGGWIMMPNADNTGVFSLAGKNNTWFTLAALITPDSVTYTIDHLRDGTIDSTYVAHTDTLDFTAANWNLMRLGTGLASAGGGADFDNVILKTISASSPRITGDTNGDGVVDLADLNNVLNNFGDTGTSPGDDNGDGVVDLTDLNNVLNNFGDTAPASALSVVPEPSALACLLAALPFFSRRRRSA